MKCAICGITVDLPEKAIDEGWTPYFFDGEIEHGPVCTGCSESLLEFGVDGEAEIKEEYQGKIKYKDLQVETPKESLVIGIALGSESPKTLN